MLDEIETGTALQFAIQFARYVVSPEAAENRASRKRNRAELVAKHGPELEAALDRDSLSNYSDEEWDALVTSAKAFLVEHGG